MFESFLTASWFQTTIVGLIVGLAVYRYIKLRKYNMPPGPWKLPLLGNVLQLGSDKRYHIKFYEWSKKYGPVITIGLGPIKVVVVNNLDTAMEVLVKKSTDFSGRQKSPSVRTWTGGYKDIAMAEYGPTWKLQRKISVKALRHYMQGDALEQRIHTALETTFPILETMKEAFNPREIVDFLIVNILLGLCFHGQYEYGNADIKYILKQEEEANKMFSDFVPEDIFPFLENIYQSKQMKRVIELRNALMRDFIGSKFHKEKETFDRDNIRHFADMLILAKEETTKEEGESEDSLTDEHLIQTIADIFFGGIDTSRTTLEFALLHMVAFPDIQKKVQEELDRGIGDSRLPGVGDRPNLAYTEAVLHESMRMATVTPSGLFHRTMVDTEISGYKIPKATLVMINHWALHNDSDAWDEVDKFKPERYLDENGRLGPKPSNWLPFGAGKRVCMGEFVAKPELHLLFAGLMQRFTWKTESGVHVSIKPEGSLFSAETPPFKVLIEKRL